MNKENNIKLFEDKNVRVVWSDEKENWYFSVVDIIAVLTEGEYQQSRNYWKWLKNKLISEGSQLVSNTNQLKMIANDGKLRDTDVMDTEQITINRALETYRKKGYTEDWINQRLKTIDVRKEYKELKGLKKENLRDNMTNMELVLNMLAECDHLDGILFLEKVLQPNGFATKEMINKFGLK